jgi:hypothetical protein
MSADISVGLPVLWLQGCDKTQGWFFFDAAFQYKF